MKYQNGWMPEEIIHVLAETYQAAALANADMRHATEALETIRVTLLNSKNHFEMWDVIDAQIGLAEAERLQPVLLALRHRFEQHIQASTAAHLHQLFVHKPEAAWSDFLRSYAEALFYWRIRFCCALADEPFQFPMQKDQDIEAIRRATRYALQERWTETYDLFLYFSQLNFLPTIHQAEFLVVAAEIQLYHFMNPDKAKELIFSAEKVAPQGSSSARGWGRYWLQAKDFKKAKEYFQRAIQLSPHFSDGYTGMGGCFEEQGQLEAAEEWYQEAIKKVPESVAGYERLFQLYGRPDLFGVHEEEIPPLLERAIAVQPSDAYRCYLDMADIYLQNKDYARSHEWFQKAIELESARLKGYLSLAYAFLEENKFNDAQVSFQKAIEVAPEAFDGYWGMAWLYEQQERWKEALHWYEESLSRRPEWDGRIRAQIGLMKWRLGVSSEAEEELLQALRREPQNDNVLVILLYIAQDYYKKVKKADAALRIYQQIRVIKGDSDEASYQNRIGDLKYYYDEYHEAVIAYLNAIAAAPNTALYHYNLAAAYRHLKDWDKAKGEVETAFRLDGKVETYKDEMATIVNAEGNDCYDRDDYDTAIEKYKAAIQIQPKEAIYYSNLSGAYEDEKRSGNRVISLDNAVSALKKAVELNPQNEKYSLRLAALEEKRLLMLHYGRELGDLLPVVTPIAMEVASDLIPYLEDTPDGPSPELTRYGSAMRSRISETFGVKVPGIRVRGNETDLAEGTYVIMLDEVPRVSGKLLPDKRLFPGRLENLQQLGIKAEQTSSPLTGEAAYWIMQEDWEKLEQAGYELWGFIEYPIRHLESVVQNDLAEYVGHEEVMNILEAQLPDVYRRMQGGSSDLSALTYVLKSLLKEKIPIVSIKEISEKFYYLFELGTSLTTIIESVRSLPPICSALPGNSNQFSFYRLGPNFELAFVQSVYREIYPPRLALRPEVCQEVLTAVRKKIASQLRVALLVEKAELRPFVKEVIELEFPHVPVLSWHELLPDLQKHVMGEIELVGLDEEFWKWLKSGAPPLRKGDE